MRTPVLPAATKKYVNKWVALSKDYRKVIAVGDNLTDVLKKTTGENKVVLKVLPNLGYAPSGR